MEDIILQMFNDNKTSINIKEISKKLKIRDYEYLKEILTKLELDGKLFCDDDDCYHKFPSNFFIKKVFVNKHGKKYILHNNHCYFLNPKLINGIINYDTIIFTKINKEFIPVKVLKRNFTKVICDVVKYKENKKRLVVSNETNLTYVCIDQKDMKKLVEGEKVLVNITNKKVGSQYAGSFIKRVGHVNEFDSELKTITYNNGFEVEYPKEVLDEIENLPTEISDDEKKGRIDKTNALIYTLDGEGAKDLDDSIEISKLKNNHYLLTVHIAHVSHYIKPGSACWNFAEKNTTSLYLVDKVFSMLHPFLSNGICSLNENEERLARSFEMEIDEYGEIINFRMYKSIIKSKKKMTYEDVNKILMEHIVPKGYEDYVDNIMLANELSKIITAKRINDGALSITNKTIDFNIDEDGQVKKTVLIQKDAEKIIENFMIYVNMCVGNYFYDLSLPFIYRNHDLPYENTVNKILNFLNSLNYNLNNLSDENYSFLIQKIIKTLEKKEEYPVLLIFILHMLKKAYYSPVNKGHFGLFLKWYSQTTAPIRRFLDLMIHTLIDYYENITDDFSLYDKLNNYLEYICEKATIAQDLADKSEYEAIQLYMLKYMEDKIGIEYSAFISDIYENFISIKTTELIDGICLYDAINSDYIYYPDSKMLVNKKANIKLKIGSKIKVKATEINYNERIIYFEINEPKLNKILIKTKIKKYS